MLTAEDLKQLKGKNIDVQEVEKQLAYFRSGFPFLQIERAATIDDGIYKLTESETQGFETIFESGLSRNKVYKFVPASGAATRMFKELYEFMSEGKETKSVKEVFDRLVDFAFYGELEQIMKQQKISPDDRKMIASSILLSPGLDYGNQPKGMILFHHYDDGSRTALEEHLVEGAQYARNNDGNVFVHFTVSPEHQAGFENLVKTKADILAQKFGVKYHISFSQQKPSTDTIAVNMDNEPIRNEKGLLFRPGGHGALLENLNDLDADIIFIKNIDNVVPDRLKEPTILYKKALAGLLMQLQKEIFDMIATLNKGVQDIGMIEKIKSFMLDHLCFETPAEIDAWPVSKQADYLLSILNRPLRVCGQVKNEGEPGGGPFWVNNPDGSKSLQIAESSQIDMNDPKQKLILANATHFNPVDLVCAVRDYTGNKFDLLKYRDPDTGFISVKSKDGTELKAQELPGLWNGAMANWNTVFVEVPIVTFNPVKTINDLLRPQHQ